MAIASLGVVGLFAIDFVPEAARTYRRNFPRTLIDRRDIREITRDARTVAELLERVNLKPGDLDILDGSPPCCEFSTAGYLLCIARNAARASASLGCERIETR